jgi:PAS domain S-box-containing protein
VLLQVLFCFLFPRVADGQVKPTRRVLILNEVGPSYPTIDIFDRAIRSTLEDSPYHFELYQEYMDVGLFPDAADQQPIRDFILRKYQNRKPEVIVTVGQEPLKFMLDAHKASFPAVPVIFFVPNGALVGGPVSDADFAGVENDMAPAETVEVALRLQPGTEHVAVVGGVSAYDKQLLAFVKQRLQRFAGRLDISYISDLSMPDILERLRHLPNHTVVLLVAVAQDAAGTRFNANEGGPIITAASNSPVFSLATNFLNHGEVGGCLADFTEEGKLAGRMALRLLNGDKPRDIPRATGVTRYMFDWKAMQRWKIHEGSLPPGSVTINKPPSFWEVYRRYVIAGVVALLAQSLAIFALLWQRARRRNAEAELATAFDAVQESERRFRLVANTAPVMIWMAGPDKLCHYFNQPWLDFTGRSLEQERGNGWTDGVHPDDLGACLRTYTDAFDRRESFKMLFRLRRHDGKYRWIFNIGVPRLNSDGSFAGYIGSCIDDTDRKLAEEALAVMGRKLIEAHEEERTWIARELHDDINQRLALLAVEMGRKTQQGPRPSAADLLGSIRAAREGIGEIARDIQGLSHRLHSSKLEYLGIVSAAKGFCQEMAEQKKVEIDFTDEGIPQRVPKELSLCLFRVLQEALQNAVKHSRAQHFRVKLRGENGELELAVSDAGVGFDQQDAINRRGLGLISMRERVQLLNGEFSIESEPGRGTTVLARVPFKSQAFCASAG